MAKVTIDDQICLSSKNSGTKLLNELMVDIIGALIPGFLFVIVVFLSVIVPIILISDFNFIENVNRPIFSFTYGGFWWVVMIVCIIFSYVVGHIFFRADLKDPDGTDVEKKVKDFVKTTFKKKYNDNQLKNLLNDQIYILKERVNDNIKKFENEDYDEDWMFVNKILLLACKKTIEDITNNKLIIKEGDDFGENILTVLFPEEALLKKFKINSKIEHPCSKKYDDDYLKQFFLKRNDLSEEAKWVISKYETMLSKENHCFSCFKRNKHTNTLEIKTYNKIFVCYCILYNQMDLGCATKERCEFPYINYYKYLLKRNLLDLTQYVNWFTVENRSKNKLNKLKIQVQLFASEANAMVNKNESHIRMSSSTYHISKFLFRLSFYSTILFSIIESILYIRTDIDFKRGMSFLDCLSIGWNSFSFSNFISYFDVKYFIALLLPLLMACLVHYIRVKITHYIHYQRLREIQYILQLYSQFKDVIEFRRNDFAGKNNMQKNSECESSN